MPPTRTAREDVRFPPISPTELDHLDLEVWLLHNPQPVQARGEDRLQAITVGKHGVQVVRGQSQGLFLPSVAVENNWDARQLLDQVCVKAGLPPTAWKDDDTALFTFEGESFTGHLPAAGTPAPTAAADNAVRAGTSGSLRGLLPRELVAMLTGGTPSYYIWGVPDGNVNGLVLLLHSHEHNGSPALQPALAPSRPAAAGHAVRAHPGGRPAPGRAALASRAAGGAPGRPDVPARSRCCTARSPTRTWPASMHQRGRSWSSSATRPP